MSDDEDDWGDYDSGPYCRHGAEACQCEERCACGHTCREHDMADDCTVRNCGCEEWRGVEDLAKMARERERDRAIAATAEAKKNADRLRCTIVGMSARIQFALTRLYDQRASASDKAEAIWYLEEAVRHAQLARA